MEKVLFLDRDGVINVQLGPRQYVSDPSQVTFVSGVIPGLQTLVAAGYQCAVLTNQMGIGLGVVTADAVDAVHRWMEGRLREQGILIRGWFVCPHLDTDQCRCRKPAPGLIEQAAAHFGIDPTVAWTLGDSPRDILMARNAGCTKNILLTNGYVPKPEELAAVADTPRFPDFPSAAAYILAEDNR